MKHRVCNKTMDVPTEAGTAYPFGAHMFAPPFCTCISGVRVVHVNNLHVFTFQFRVVVYAKFSA
jgi:hypothetical protein